MAFQGSKTDENRLIRESRNLRKTRKSCFLFGILTGGHQDVSVVNEFKRGRRWRQFVRVMGQQKQMLQQVLDASSVVPDYDLAITSRTIRFRCYYRYPDAHSGSPQSGEA